MNVLKKISNTFTLISDIGIQKRYSFQLKFVIKSINVVCAILGIYVILELVLFPRLLSKEDFILRLFQIKFYKDNQHFQIMEFSF